MYHFTHELTLKNQNDTPTDQSEVSFKEIRFFIMQYYYIQYFKIYQYFWMNFYNIA